VRVILDTVILVRSLINPYSLWGRIVFDHASRYRWVVSSAIESEYLEVIGRPELVRKYRNVATRDVDTVIAQLSTATVVETSAEPRVCRDPEDDKFLAAAEAGNARYIVTEDLDLLALRSYKGIRIATAASFMHVLDAALGEKR
jgi:uncharacterized protein